MEGVSGGEVRRRRGYNEELEETDTKELTAAELVREKLRTREISESDELSKVSTKENVDQAVREVKEEEGNGGEISRKLEEAIEETKRMEQESKSTEEKLREALEDLDEPTEKIEEKPEVKFTSMEVIERVHQQHEHLEKELTPETIEKCEQYMRVVNEDPEVSDSEVADKEGLEERTVKKWRAGESVGPTSYFRELERPRMEHERDVSDEALEHRIDPEDVREVTAEALEQEELSVKELTDIVEQLHEKIDNPELNSVHYAELYNTEKFLMDDRLRDLAQEMRVNLEDIEADLNRRLGLDKIDDQEMRVAVTDNRLYYWHVDNSPDRWLNVLADQKFYMSKEDKHQLIDETVKHLHVRGGGETSEYYLNDLLSQLTRLENPAANRMRRYDSVYSFDGEVSHFIGDVTGRSLEDFKQIFSHMGTKEAARVSNLRFPDVHEFRMRFVAIIESDGHIDGYGRLSYYEKNVERRKIVTDFFQEFGDFVIKEKQEELNRVNLPIVYGAMAKYWGIPEGDKGIHNSGLDETIIKEQPEVKTYYSEELVGEDGCVSGTRISVRRHHTLHAGKKTEAYQLNFGISSTVNENHIDLIREFGTGLDKHLNYEKDAVVVLYISELARLTKSGDSSVSDVAMDLLQITENNPNKLLGDEVIHIIEPLGIEMICDTSHLRYYRDSERLSVVSTAATATVKDTIRWVLISPPNHPEKLEKARTIIRNHPQDVQEIKQNIVNDGLNIHPVWKNNEFDMP